MPKQLNVAAATAAKVKKLYASGEIGSEVAGEMLGCTSVTALNFLRREGVKIRGRGRPKKTKE